MMSYTESQCTVTNLLDNAAGKNKHFMDHSYIFPKAYEAAVNLYFSEGQNFSFI